MIKKRRREMPQNASEVCTEGWAMPETKIRNLVLIMLCTFIHDSVMSRHNLGDSTLSSVK